MIRLANEKPELRRHLVPMLRLADTPKYQDYVEKKKDKGEKPLPKEDEPEKKSEKSEKKAALRRALARLA